MNRRLGNGMDVLRSPSRLPLGNGRTRARGSTTEDSGRPAQRQQHGYASIRATSEVRRDAEVPGVVQVRAATCFNGCRTSLLAWYNASTDVSLTTRRS